MMTHVAPLNMHVMRDASAIRQMIAIVHAVPLMRLGLAETLRASLSLSQSKVLAFANLNEAERVLAEAVPGDVIILDTNSWGLLEGPGGAPQLQALKARGIIVGLIASAGRDAAKLLSSRGISGLLSPDAELEMVIALAEDLTAGRMHFPQSELPSGVPARLSRLSSRQFEILELMTRGLLNKQIAWELGLTEGTVKSHVSAILDKLGCDRRTQAITAFMQCFGVGQQRAAFA
jgi:DNA-binding NarL/FixJ family response regulator